MPTQRATQFQVFNRPIPAIETHQFGIKPTLESGKQHILKMIVFGFAVRIFVKDAIVNRNAAHAVTPEQGNQVDAAHNFFLLARPMAIDQGIKPRIGFLKGRIIENQNAGVNINLRSSLLPERFGIGLQARQKASKSVVGGSVFALRLNTLGFGGSYIARRSDDKVDVISASNFWRIHSLFLSNNSSTA
jgi:hypothetical protein